MHTLTLIVHGTRLTVAWMCRCRCIKKPRGGGWLWSRIPITQLDGGAAKNVFSIGDKGNQAEYIYIYIHVYLCIHIYTYNDAKYRAETLPLRFPSHSFAPVFIFALIFTRALFTLCVFLYFDVHPLTRLSIPASRSRVTVKF